MIEYSALFIGILTPLMLFLGRKTILEWIKSSFAKEIEQFKHELDVKKEVLKQDLSREAQKVSYLSSSKQTIYPEFYEKLRVTEGSVGLLHGLQLVPSYSKFPTEELFNVVKNLKAVDGMKQEIEEAIRRDRAEGIKALESLIREIEISDAKKKCQDAKNFLILKTLYFSKPVYDKSFEIIKMFNALTIDIQYMQENRIPYEKISGQAKAIEQAIDALESEMRKEMFGEQI